MRTPSALVVLALAACGGVQRPDGGEGLLPVESVAPDFAARDANGKTVRLQQTRGTPSIVYFYPMDDTPGCTKEACAFRDAWEQLNAAHTTVFGVSRDGEESHDRFRAAHKLPFPLAADESGDIARAYGVKSTLGMAARVTFLIGADGRVAKVYPDVDPALHVREILSDIHALPASTPSSE